MIKRLLALTFIFILVVGTTPQPVRAEEEKPPIPVAGLLAPAIVSAISAATPAIPEMMSRIWKTGDSKIRKEELKTNLESVRSELIKEANQKLQPVLTVADELDVTIKFLDPSVKANKSILTMQATLRNVPSTPAGLTQLWRDLDTEWRVAKQQLAVMGNIPMTEINRIREVSLRGSLVQVREVNMDHVIRVDSMIANKNRTEIPALQSTLTSLTEKLSAVNIVVGLMMADLSSDIKQLKTAPQTAPDTNIRESLQRSLQTVTLQ